MIKRDYWFEREGGSVDMELTVRVNGKPLSLEKGESKHNMAQRWIEAFIPLAISQRFLFDGEKLPGLHVSELNEEFREGLDDILGQQAIQQLNSHLNSIMKATTKQMTPEDDQKALDEWFVDLDLSREEEISLTDQLTKKSKELDKCVEKATSLQKMIVSKGKEEGESLGEVRAKQAIAASHLAGRRKELIRVISESLPSSLQEFQMNWTNGESFKQKKPLKITWLQTQQGMFSTKFSTDLIPSWKNPM